MEKAILCLHSALLFSDLFIHFGSLFLPSRSLSIPSDMSRGSGCPIANPLLICTPRVEKEEEEEEEKEKEEITFKVCWRHVSPL